MDQLILPGLLLFILVREVLSHRERADMLDRLMSKDFPEYKAETQPEDNQIAAVEDDGTVDIGEAEEELNGRED